MAISYIADASWQSATSNTSFTLTKPTGTASGDYMVAIIAIDTFSGGGGDVTVTPPSGWTSQGHTFNGNLAIDVMTRTAGGSEPSTWAGSLSASRAPKTSIVTTYRGTSGLAIDGTSTVGSSTSFNTATVNNPSSSNWRTVQAAYTSASVSFTMTSSEVSNRDIEALSTVEAGAWDSNGTIASGNTSRSVSRSQVWESACSWIGILSVGGGATSANAGTVTATDVANAPKISVKANAGAVTVTATVNQPAHFAKAETATATAVANTAEAVKQILAGAAAATATAYNAVVAAVINAPAGAVSATTTIDASISTHPAAVAVSAVANTPKARPIPAITAIAIAYNPLVNLNQLGTAFAGIALGAAAPLSSPLVRNGPPPDAGTGTSEAYGVTAWIGELGNAGEVNAIAVIDQQVASITMRPSNILVESFAQALTSSTNKPKAGTVTAIAIVYAPTRHTVPVRFPRNIVIVDETRILEVERPKQVVVVNKEGAIAGRVRRTAGT